MAEERLAEQKAQEESMKKQFIEEQKTFYRQKLEAEELRLKDESDAKVAKHKQAMSTKVDTKDMKIRQLQGRCEKATQRNAQDQKTLDLYVKEARQLESRVRELERKYPLPKTSPQNWSVLKTSVPVSF